MRPEPATRPGTSRGAARTADEMHVPYREGSYRNRTGGAPAYLVGSLQRASVRMCVQIAGHLTTPPRSIP